MLYMNGYLRFCSHILCNFLAFIEVKYISSWTTSYTEKWNAPFIPNLRFLESYGFREN
jgi:hypothetical protein